jgi:iron(III) transport system permease protein
MRLTVTDTHLRPLLAAARIPRVLGTRRAAAGAVLMLVSGLLVGAPLMALVASVLEGEPGAILEALSRAGLPSIVLSMFVLAVGATGWSLVVAVPLAWLVARTDLPARHVVRWLAPLPLAIPPYVAAIAYAALLSPGGMVHVTLASLLEVPLAAIQWPRVIYGTGGAAFVLGIFMAPSVFLTVESSLARTNPSLEEASRGLGYGPWSTLTRVTIPLARPAILAGGLLVFVYACVDFGVVSILRTKTVTTTLYTYLLAGFSRPASAVIALSLVLIIWLALAMQARLAGNLAHRHAGARARLGAPPVRLGWWRWVALTYCVVVLSLGLVLPLVVLVSQAARLGLPSLASFLVAQGPFLWRSLVVATTGATCALFLGIVVALAQGRLPAAGITATIFQAGYAVPGTVLGLALVGLLIRAVPAVYGSPAALVLAYVILFASPAYQACRAALSQVSPALDWAARGLGSSPLESLRRVVFPLAAPGLVGSWALTFALAFRELAATVVIRPPGYDTLPVRIWVHTMDVGPDPRASAVALLALVVAAAVWLADMRLSRPLGTAA